MGVVLRDKNGVDVSVGMRAVVLRFGEVGDVRAVHGCVAALRGKPGVRIASGPDDNPKWSAWCTSNEFVAIPVEEAPHA